MKKKLLLTLSIAFIVLFTAGVMNVSAGIYGDLTYETWNNEVKITDCSIGATEVIIPETINGYPVTMIGMEAFKGCTKITDLQIPDSVTTILGNAFSGCRSLTTIDIPDGVTTIDGGVFSGCINLTSISLPDSVTYIGEYAFSRCSSLTNITIPDGVTSIENYTFSNCSNLTSITIPDSITNIEKYAFQSCRNIKTINYYGENHDIDVLELHSRSDCLATANIIYIPNTKTTIYDDGHALTVKPKNIEPDKTIILALYNGKELVEAQTAIYMGEDVPFFTPKSYTNVKVMVWDDLDTGSPVCEAEEI